MLDLIDLLIKYPLLPPLGLLIFDTIAMSYITSFAHTLSNFYLLIPVLLFEGIAWFFLVFMIRHRGLGVTNAIWDIGSLLLVTLIAVLQFKEKIILRHYIGIILGMISISLLLKK